tara:strand:- start:184 stop:552 length:369 start_codon:yes stop_codon:yes gene_type:complete
MTKIIFHLLNIILIFIYIYPGSLIGYLIYSDISKQPQVTPDFLQISSNHFYTFLLLSLLGLLSYLNNFKTITLYLILISIILELFHLFIPNRSFQFSDLFGNMIGVLIPIIVLTLFNFWRKK